MTRTGVLRHADPRHSHDHFVLDLMDPVESLRDSGSKLAQLHSRHVTRDGKNSVMKGAENRVQTGHRAQAGLCRQDHVSGPSHGATRCGVSCCDAGSHETPRKSLETATGKCRPRFQEYFVVNAGSCFRGNGAVNNAAI
jgi:hypothetical protein